MKWIRRLAFRQSESPEAARKRRRCRMMLGLPPETVYHHVCQGLATLGALGVLFFGLVGWRLGHLQTVASTFGALVVVGVLGVTCLRIHRRYRHVAAGIVVLVALVGLLGAAGYHYGHLERVAALGGLTHSIVSR